MHYFITSKTLRAINQTHQLENNDDMMHKQESLVSAEEGPGSCSKASEENKQLLFVFFFCITFKAVCPSLTQQNIQFCNQ